VTISQPDYVAYWLLLSSSRVLRISLQVFKHLSQLLFIVRAKNKMLSLAALLTNTVIFIFLTYTYPISVSATTRASVKRDKKVSRNAELTDYAKSSARDHQLFPLCVHATQCAPDYQTNKKCTKRGRNRACFWNEFHALPSPQSTLIYLPSEQQQQRQKTNQMKWDESTLEI
jgi:hypothetical protein